MGGIGNLKSANNTSRIGSLWFRWLVITGVAGAISWLAVAVGMLFTLGTALLASGTVVGFGIGLAQKRLLMSSLPRLDWSRWVIGSW